MIFVTGPRYSGKHVFVRNVLNMPDDSYGKRFIQLSLEDVGKAADIDAYAKELSGFEVVVLPEVGSGVVPLAAEDVDLREKCGELAQRLASEADVVVRVLCGIPKVLKGTLDL